VCFFVGCVVQVKATMFEEGMSEENDCKRRGLRPGFMAWVVWGKPLHVGAMCSYCQAEFHGTQGLSSLTAKRYRM
jgi:hypothetical protein